MLIQPEKLVESRLMVRGDQTHPRSGQRLVIKLRLSQMLRVRLYPVPYIIDGNLQWMLMNMQPCQPQMICMAEARRRQGTRVKCREEFGIAHSR